MRIEPILLTPSNSLDPAVSQALADLHATTVTIVGGPAAVSGDVETAIKVTGISTSRLAGSDRYATSVAVVSAVAPNASDNGVTLVSGRNWPDAIAAGASAKPPMVLVDPVSLANSPATQAWLQSRSTSLVVAVGGPDVVSPDDTVGALTNPLP
jgi:putative cell wall-binding protein